MNEREHALMEQLISGMAEVKQELASVAMHLERQNGTIAKHFAADAVWFAQHDLQVAQERGYRSGRGWALGVVVAVASVVGPLVVRLMLGS